MAAPKINLARGLNFGMNFDTSAFDGAVKSVSTSLTKLGSEFKSFGEDMSKHMDKMTKSISALDKGIKKLADTTKEAAGAGGGLGGIAGMFTKALGSLGSLGSGAASSFLGPLVAIGGPLMSALSGALTGAISFAVTQAIGILQRGIEWQKGFTNIGRMMPISQLTPQVTDKVLEIHERMNKEGIVPGFPLEDQMAVANQFVALGKRRGMGLTAPKGMQQLEDLTKVAGVAGEATGMGANRTAEILMEQSRSFAMNIPQMKEYADTMMAVSRVSGMSADQMSNLNDVAISMGRTFGKTGDEAKRFATDAVLVGGELSLMGFNVGDMLQKMTQQTTGSEAGLLQSLILGGPAGNVTERFKKVQDVSQQIMSMASGMPEEFREYFMTQVAGPMGLSGFTATDITQMGKYATEKEFREAQRTERLGEEKGTSEDYLSQIAAALADPEKFFKPAAVQIQTVIQLIENKLTKIGSEWADKLGNAIKDNMPKIADFIEKIGTLISEAAKYITEMLTNFIPNALKLLGVIAEAVRKMAHPLDTFNDWITGLSQGASKMEAAKDAKEVLGEGTKAPGTTTRKELIKAAQEAEAGRLESVGGHDLFKMATPEGYPKIEPSMPQGTDLASEIASKYGVDPVLFKALIKQESGGKTDAVSRKGALGLAQVMPKTAQGMRPGITKEQMLNPMTNLELGAEYLKEQLTKYKGDKEKALAAYNMGPSALDKLLAQKSSTPWQERLKTASPETAEYLQKVKKYESEMGSSPSKPVYTADVNLLNETQKQTPELQKIASRPLNSMSGVMDPSAEMDSMLAMQEGSSTPFHMAQPSYNP